MIRRSFIALLLAVALAGCGGAGGSKSTTTTTSPSTTTPTPVKYTFPPMLLPQNSSDVNQADKISLTVDALPQGWEATLPGYSRVPRPEIEEEVLVQCLFGENPSPLSAYVASAVYVSPDFRTLMKSFVRVVDSKASGARDFSSFTADRIAKCQDGMFDYEHNPPKDVVEVVNRKFGYALPVKMPVDPLPLTDGSKDSLGFRMIISPTDRPATHQDIFAYGAGRYETILIVQGPVVPDQKVENDVFKYLKGRTLVVAAQG